MRIERRFTTAGQDPYQGIAFKSVTSEIRNPDGSRVFYLPDIDVPQPHEPMDFVAWLEAYVGDRWYTFDPRNNTRRTGRVLIGRGRDALDIAMMTHYGAAPLRAMRVAAEPLDAPPWSSASPPVLGEFPGDVP